MNSEWFKKYINNEEIAQIDNFELRSIREKYWILRFEAFKDEHGIPDCELENVTNRLDEEEQKEIDAFKIRNNIKNI